MSNVNRKFIVFTATCAIAIAGLSGCSTTGRNIDSGAELAKVSSSASDTVVFGRFRVVRNGQEAKLGDGLVGSSARLKLIGDGQSREIVGKVGRNGEFAWVLQPGDYSVNSVAFSNRGDRNRGERIETPTNLSFTVSTDKDATYIGTITVEATLDGGYYGVGGTIDRYTVSNDCSTVCADRLAALGLAPDAVAVSLLRQEGRMAVSN
jgi:hypothetical protein